MSFNWNDYLKLARGLLQLAEADMPFSTINEAAHRAAISRAYYAAFCSCREYIVENRSHEVLLSNNPSVHSELISYFKTSLGTTERKLAKLLSELRENRNLADYQNDLDGSLESMSKDAIEQARKILELLKSL